MAIPPLPWHALPAARVLAEVGSSVAGLSPADAGTRLAKDGPNRLPEPPRRGPFLRFLLHFHNILIYVLLGAAAVTAALGHLIDTAVILAVVVVNAVIGFVQEGRAEQAMDAIRHMLAPRASVLRGGQRREVPGEALVVGDLVLLEAGDKIPADVRLVEVRGFQVQEAILTGESVPVAKRIEAVEETAGLGDRGCMGFSGTLVTSGSARGVVVATGAATQIGRISGLLAEVEQLSTPLVGQMSSFARWLTALILVIAAVLLGYGYFVAHHEFSEMFMAVVGLSVAAIPEGLPAVLTITLAVGVQTMAKRNAIVRRLPAIETLGSVSVICSDKTGTLTRNEMLATRVALAETTLDVRGEGYRPSGEVEHGDAPVPDQARLHELARTLRLCNDAALHEDQGTWTALGDPMEAALLALGAKLGPEQLTEGWVRRDAIPFDAKHRYMATLDAPAEGPAQIHIKGAPEQVLGMCTWVRAADGGDSALDPEVWLERVHALASAGQRVLAIANKPATSAEQASLASADVEHGACLLGLVGLIDPPRPEAITAVAECHSAGIRVKMITGDHARTALAIGRQIGLQNPERVLTGAEIDGLDDSALEHAVLDTDVFARTSPEHKLRLVMALQANGLTVAMTGDGVNDAPALKRADAGVAMGRGGSEAAKEAAELVLADDNFASIAAAVREGRTVYDNIRKVVTWTLPTNAGEALTVIVALLAGWALPITPVQILWVNLITAVTLGLALAFEPTEDQTMARPPRPRDEALLNGSLVWHVVFVSLLFLAGVFGMFTYGVDRGYPLELSRTLALNTLVALEVFHLFFVRNIHGTSLTWKLVRGTPMVWLTVGGVTLAQFVITYLPAAQAVFATAPVRLLDGLLIVGVGVALLIVLEIEKQLRLIVRER